MAHTKTTHTHQKQLQALLAQKSTNSLQAWKTRPFALGINGSTKGMPRPTHPLLERILPRSVEVIQGTCDAPCS